MFRKKIAGKVGKAATGKARAGSKKRALAAAEAALHAKAVSQAEAAGAPTTPAAAAAVSPSPKTLVKPAAHVPQASQHLLKNKVKAAAAATTASGAARSPPEPISTDGLGSILDVFRASVEPLADLDETITTECKDTAPTSSLKSSTSASNRAVPTPITYHTFAASLTCEKKFFLLQERPDLVPKLSIGEAMHLDDAAGFNELARRWDRLQFGSKATLIADKSFDAAAAHTEEVINYYFETTYASLGEQAPSLTIHRPAFAAPFGRARGTAASEDRGSSTSGSSSSTSVADNPLILQARPAVLRYRPKDNQWVILEAQAVVDPLGTTARAAQCLQRIHFSMMAFRYWVTQPHIPISVRKRFLSLDLDGITQENLKGRRLQDSAAVTAPIDLQRSGILHIRQYFPGPVTLMDCPPQRLVKYVQRLSLEDLLEVDRRNATKHAGSTGAFDLQNLENLDAAVLQARTRLQTALQQAGRHTNARSTRSLKQKDSDEHVLFEAQQQLMEALLRTHTTKLVERARDPKQRERWSTFAEDTPDGQVRSTYGHLQEQQEASGGVTSHKKKGAEGKKSTAAAAAMAAAATAELDTPLIPVVPCFSENLGAYCSRGDVCPFFTEGKCLPQKVDDPIVERDNHLFTLPSTAVSRKVVWWAEGMRTVRDVLYRYKQGKVKLTAPQLRYCKAVAEGEVAINPKEIEKFFSKLRYPIFIIDFEAAQFALPPFQKVTAYQSVPFQFSMDVFQEDILTETPTHYDFLHFGKGYSPNGDPRPHLVEELMRVVQSERDKKKAAMEASGEMEKFRAMEAEAQAAAEAASAHKRGRKPKNAPKPLWGAAAAESGDGPLTPYDGCFIAHYASFEKSCLEKMSYLEDKHREAIKNFYFLDTMDLIRKGFIHPNAGGSNSLKKVLPALCPDFQYGVFGNEEGDPSAEASGDGRGSSGKSSSSSSGSSGSASAAAMEDVTGGDESSQKGENAMGVYRLWYHQEGGGTLQDFHRAAALPGSVAVPPMKSRGGATADSMASPNGDLTQAARDKVWRTLRIQLLEYCSLDTKALYEIMREIWKEKELAKDVPPADKTGWVFTKPTLREVSF